MTILEKIEILRAEKRFQKKEIADIAEICPATYARIISGKSCPSFTTFYKLGKMVGATDERIKKEHEKIKLSFKLKKTQIEPDDEQELLNTIGKRIKTERMKSNMTQKELGAKIDTDPKIISKLESAYPSTYSFNTLIHIGKQALEYLDVPFDEVYKQNDTPEEQLTLIDKTLNNQDVYNAILDAAKSIGESLNKLTDIVNKALITKEN